MFQIRDFIIDNNEVVKIIATYPDNNQLDTDKHGLITACTPNITLDKEVLSACGFALNQSSGRYEVKLN